MTEQNDPVVSEVILAEYRRVLTSQRFQRFRPFSDQGVARYLMLLSEAAIHVRPGHTPNVITRDPTDNMILAAAETGRVDYIASGDRHLLELGEYLGIPILPPAALLALLTNPPD